MSTWAELTEHLYVDLLHLAAGDVIILYHGNRYVQLCQRPELLHAEASNNEFLHGDDQLTDAQEQMMTEVGWQQPPPGMCNWNLDLAWPSGAASTRAFAQTLTTTLETIFGVPETSALRLDAWNDAANSSLNLRIAQGIERVAPG